MNYICPICNGFQSLSEHCQSCGQLFVDGGRVYDYYGDYSPYRPIEDSKLSNGLPDAQQHLCIHMGWCEHCKTEAWLAIQEWTR